MCMGGGNALPSLDFESVVEQDRKCDPQHVVVGADAFERVASPEDEARVSGHVPQFRVNSIEARRKRMRSMPFPSAHKIKGGDLATAGPASACPVIGDLERNPSFFCVNSP